ncbi:MAG: hypothetical protein OH333_00885 [Candidatus Parvarchaeota archaeon]|nr:hypothetical protein [Candidatus Jingweiarchaeum tengchongense]
MSNNTGYYWEKVVGNESLKIDLHKLKSACATCFSEESDNYKQKLVYELLEAVRNNDQNEFFYIILKAINKPEENFKELWMALQKNYDLMPEEVFVNFAYSIIIGIMSSYGGEKNE